MDFCKGDILLGNLTSNASKSGVLYDLLVPAEEVRRLIGLVPASFTKNDLVWDLEALL